MIIKYIILKKKKNHNLFYNSKYSKKKNVLKCKDVNISSNRKVRTPNFSNKIFNNKSFIRDKRYFCRVKSKFFERI